MADSSNVRSVSALQLLLVCVRVCVGARVLRIYADHWNFLPAHTQTHAHTRLIVAAAAASLRCLLLKLLFFQFVYYCCCCCCCLCESAITSRKKKWLFSFFSSTPERTCSRSRSHSQKQSLVEVFREFSCVQPMWRMRYICLLYTGSCANTRRGYEKL